MQLLTWHTTTKHAPLSISVLLSQDQSPGQKGVRAGAGAHALVVCGYRETGRIFIVGDRALTIGSSPSHTGSRVREKNIYIYKMLYIIYKMFPTP